MQTVNQFPHAVEEHENVWIEMRDGCRLAARMWLPVDAVSKPVPAILEYIPYRKRDGTAERDALTHPYFAGHGYACLRVDMRGNGESDGVMLDEYALQEQEDALDVIAWIAAQPWCTGAVGMMGISWGGFNALQVAACRPEALKAIITLCSTDDRYTDDIHYKGGCVINENLGWGGTMLAYSSRPPDPVLVGDMWRDMWLERLEAEPFLAADWLRRPHRDDYWKHGSVCEDYAAIEAAVLAVGGWNDAYSNAIPRLVNNLKSITKGIIGPWAHKYPHFAVPGPRIGFLQEALRWWDFWLKGEPTGVIRDPGMRVYVMESIAPDNLPAHWPGRWISDIWPPATSELHRLHLTGDGLREGPGGAGERQICSPQTTGKDGGEFCVIWLGPEFPGDQAEDDEGSLVFDSGLLGEAIDLCGAAVLELDFSVDRPVAQVALRLNDVRPDGAVTRITYTIRNLCHHDSHEHPSPLEPGRRYTTRIRLDDVAWHLPTGHKLRLSISTCYWPLMWPSPEPVILTVHTGSSILEVPIRRPVSGEQPPVFAEPVAAPAQQTEQLREPVHTRQITTNPATGEVKLEILDDFGKARDAVHGLTTGTLAREVHTIMPDDPLSARMQTHWTEELERQDWRIRTETYSAMTADAEAFLLTARIEAYENDELVFSRDFSEKIPRQLN